MKCEFPKQAPLTAYRKGCRCGRCKAACAARQRKCCQDPAVRQANIDRSRQFRRRRKAEYDAIVAPLRAAGCQGCGSDHVDLLHFHHRDPATKLFKPADWVSRSGLTVQELHEELAKCDVLCERCHVAAHEAMRQEVAA